MNLNITDMFITYGEKVTFDWDNFWITAFGALFGALCAFALNYFYEIQKNNSKIYCKTNELLGLLNQFYEDLKSLKTNIENNEKGMIYTPLLDISTTIDEKDYYFLSRYNPYITSLLHQILVSYKILINMITEYNLYFQKNFNCLIDNSENMKNMSEYKKNYLNILKNILILNYLLQRSIYKNTTQTSNKKIIKSILRGLVYKIKEIYPNYKNEEVYISWNNSFNNIRRNKCNIYCYSCIKKQQIKDCIYKFASWFKKPNVCSAKECNLNKDFGNNAK